MFDLYTERVIQKTGLHSEEEGVKIGEGNDSRYADDIILLAERSHDLKQLLMNFNNNQKKKKKNPLLMRVKEESAKVELHLSIKKTKILTTKERQNFNIVNKNIEIF